MTKPTKASPDVPPGVESLSYEDAIAELESIIDRIESGEIGLEDSVKAYERGVALRRHCESILARAEQRVVELTPGAAPPPADPR